MKIRTKIFNSTLLDLSENGWLYFDVIQNEDKSLFKITKILNELIEPNKIQLDKYYNINILKSDKNLRILEQLYHPNNTETITSITIDIITGDKIFREIKCTVRYVKQYIQLNINFYENHWGDRSKKLKVKDINIEDFEYSLTNVKTSHVEKWINGQSEIIYPLIDFGRIIKYWNNELMSLQLFRPFIFLTALLKQGFCDIGWKLNAPILESEYGRKLIGYFIRNDLGIENAKELNGRMSRSDDFETVFLYFGNGGREQEDLMVFNTIEGNPDLFEWRTFSGTGGNIVEGFKGVGEFNVEIDVSVTADSKKDYVQIQLVRIPKNYYQYAQIIPGNRPPIDEQLVIAETGWKKGSETPVTVNFNKSLSNVSIFENEILAIVVRMRRTSPLGFSPINPDVDNFSEGFTVLAGSSIELECVRKYYKEGDILKWSEITDGEISLLDVLKGVAQIYNLKFDTDYINKTLNLYQPFKLKMNGEEYEAYYTDDIKYLSQVDNSEQIIINAQDNNRYIRVQFKDFKDKFIDTLNLKEPLFSALDDLGDNYKDDTTTITNGIFRPSACNIIKRPLKNNTDLYLTTINIYKPYKDYSEITWDVGILILFWYGNVVQKYHGKISKIKWDISETKTNLIPFAAQYNGIYLGEHNNTNENNLTQRIEHIIFNKNPEYNSVIGYDTSNKINWLYALVYKYWLIQNIKSKVFSILNFNVDLDTSFRHIYTGKLFGETVYGRLKTLRNIDIDSEKPNIIELITFDIKSIACGFEQIPEDINDCINRMFLKVSYNENTDCYTFNVDGAHSDNIIEYIYYKSYDEITWIEIPTIPVNKAEVCNETQDFYVKCDLIFEHCPNITTNTIFIPNCININGEIIIEYFGHDDNGVCYVAYLQITDDYGNIINNYTLDSFTYNIDGNTEIPYTENEMICINGNVLTFTAIVHIKNCDSIEITNSINIGDYGYRISCDSFINEVFCEEDDNGCITFIRNGYPPFDNIRDLIFYSILQDNGNYGEWILWDGEPLCENIDLKVQRFIEFCDDACPMNCSTVNYCSVSGCNFVLGDAPTVSVCNDGNI